jgi:hypothetical protein
MLVRPQTRVASWKRSKVVLSGGEGKSNNDFPDNFLVTSVPAVRGYFSPCETEIGTFLRATKRRLRSQFSRREVILGGNAERIRHAVEERKHCRDVNRFRNLFLAPACIAQFLNVLVRGLIGGLCYQLNIIEQSAFRRRKPGLLEFALENRIDALITGSLNTQEVGMAVQSIRAPVQVGDVTRNHLLVAAREMAFGEMNGVGKLEHLPQEIRACAEALDNSRNLLASRTGAPVIVGSGYFAGGIGVLDDPDFGRRFGWNDLSAFRLLAHP